MAEGPLVGAWAVQGKSLLSRHFVSNGLLVELSEVTYVDSVGKQLFLWLRDLQAKFVAETWYARVACERLQLDLKGKGDAGGRGPLKKGRTCLGRTQTTSRGMTETCPQH